MSIQDFLDFAREELLAATVDDLLATAGELNVAAFVNEAAKITGAEPSVLGERGCVGGRITMVAEMNARSSRGDFPDLAKGHIVAGAIQNAQFHVADDPADGPVHFGRVIGEARIGMESGLEHSVELYQMSLCPGLIGANGFDRRRS